jgi:hypothetical protein
MKESLFQIKKKIFAFLSVWQKRIFRPFVNKGLTEERSYSVPVIINNRNRYSHMLRLIQWLEKNGYKNIYILDNDSTYPPLTEYYKSSPHHIIYLKKNVGYQALWRTNVFDLFKNDYYVYTDPDVVPNDNCPKDVVFQLYKVLKNNFSIEKCGVALKIDDLPSHYKNKEAVIADEKKHWMHKVSENVYDAPVDSTFALYRPLAKGRAEDCKAYRLSGKYDFHHLPWYENSADLTEEDKYYISHVSKGSTMWTERN